MKFKKISYLLYFLYITKFLVRSQDVCICYVYKKYSFYNIYMILFLTDIW